MLRRRKDPITSLHQLDAFPKVPDTSREKSTTGGTSNYFWIYVMLHLTVLISTLLFHCSFSDLHCHHILFGLF